MLPTDSEAFSTSEGFTILHIKRKTLKPFQKYEIKKRIILIINCIGSEIGISNG